VATVSTGVGSGLARLVQAAGAALGDDPPQALHAGVVGTIERAMRRALTDPELVPPGVRCSRPLGGFAKYLLHADPAFVIFGTVTAPEVAAPIHDHGSWGVVGLFRGVEEEVRYLVEPIETEAGEGRLREVGRAVYVAGDAMVIEPPPGDVHQVFNRGEEPSIAVHLFRGDLVTSGFRIFEPPGFLPTHTGALSYDPVPPAPAREGP
jgi:predicted metal-dependent enzyme (double-stranded beta helix superfamily)